MTKAYLDTKLTYTEDNKLIDEFGNCVMMGWEKEWMKASAEVVCKNGGDILNIGFGLGIIDTYIQEYKPSSHWIVEAHPDVYSKMLEDGWHRKDNVKVIFGKWQDVVHTLPSFDGIYLDTFMDSGLGDKFIPQLKKLLKPSGIFSYWEGKYNKYINPELTDYLVKDFDFTFEVLKLSGIPSYKEQGGVYINEKWDQCIIPVITHKKNYDRCLL